MKPMIVSCLGLTACVVAVACGSAPEPSAAPIERVATTASRLDPATVAKGALDAVQALYGKIGWFNCHAAQWCPETDVEKAADRTILAISTEVEAIDNNHMVAGVHDLLSRSARFFGDAANLSHDDESGLLTDTGNLFQQFVQKLSATDPTNQAEVDAAYALAPSFNVLAAFLDHLSRIELVRDVVPMTLDFIHQNRALAFATNEALAGSLDVGYACGDGTRVTSTAQSFDGSMPTKKLWKRFADYRFGTSDYSNDCNIFRLVTAPGQKLCAHDCSSDFLGACTAGGLTPNDSAYAHELPKVLAKMNRDPVINVIRAANEKLAAGAALPGSKVLWRDASGELALWNVLSGQSYEPFDVAHAGFDWQPMTTGDFDGDGVPDILWTNNGLAGLWLMSGNGLGTMTAANPAPVADRAFSGDLDGDGVSDVVWSLPPTDAGFETVTWIMSPGTTTPRSTSTFTSSTDRVQGVGDFDADASHRADILYRDQAGGEVSIAFDGGDETAIGWAPLDWQIQGVGDFNGDGYADILWYNVNSGAVAVWAMQGATIVANVTTGTSDPAGGWAIQGVGDFDHDGISDILWRQASSGYVNTWMLAAPDRIRLATDPVSVDPGTGFAGILDLGANPSPSGQMAAIQEPYCGATSGTALTPGFTDYQSWWNGSFFGTHGTLLGDVDGDGKADLVGLGDGYVGVVRSVGTGYGDYETGASQSFYGSHGTLLADVDGDNRADLIALGDHDVRVRLSQAATPATSFGSGDTFTDWSLYWGSGFYGSQGTFAGDVDGDGKADLVGVGSDYIGVLISRGTSFGIDYQRWYFGPIQSSRGVLFGDVNGDGRSDVVLVGPVDVRVLLSTGTSFAPPVVWYSGSIAGTQQTLLADVDGNGRADLIAIDDASIRVARAYSDASSSYFGRPDGFGTGAGYEVWWGRPWTATHGVLAGDIDGNTSADLVALGDGYIGVIRSQ